MERMTAAAAQISGTGALLVAVGGDHSISFPVGRGVIGHHDRVDVVHLDAHGDFHDDAYGSRFSHVSNLRRLSELPEVDGVAALGLRNVDRGQLAAMEERGVRVATTSDIQRSGPTAIAERAVPNEVPIYLSIDIDVLDAAVVPGTTAPEPGGLSYTELRALLDAIVRRGQVVGLDVVELNTHRESHGVTARVTAWLILHLLASIFDARADGGPPGAAP
jgi:agmatinase